MIANFLIIAAWFGCILIGGCSILYDFVGGSFVDEPSEFNHLASSGAKELVAEAFADLGPKPIVDFHVHLIGRNVNPNWLSWTHPVQRTRTMVYLSAAGVEPKHEITQPYVVRLIELIKAIPQRGRYFLVALDRHYRLDGTVDWEHTLYYMSNESVYRKAMEHPDLFVPVISIHPYREDAIAELTRWAQKGCRYVKWIPNTMGLDPSSDRLDNYYQTMKKFGMTLLSHSGEKKGFPDAKAFQHLGNPLLLKKPLDIGVKVVIFHSATPGKYKDLDHPTRNKKVFGFDLLIRMLENPAYQGLLFGEISAITFFNHLDRPLRILLEREDLHKRLVNGSDYPLPGINLLIRTSKLVEAGFITKTEANFLDEIYGYNPLLFDFVLKRTVRHPVNGRQFPPTLFELPPELSIPLLKK